jgi:hypothetical protein
MSRNSKLLAGAGVRGSANADTKRRSIMTKQKNAMLHDAYSEDDIIFLPGERPEGFEALLRNTRLEFGLRETEQDESVLRIARLRWKTRRLDRLAESEFVKLAREGEKSGKKSRKRKKARKKVSYTNALARLSEQLALFVGALNKVSPGKLGANSMIRSMASDIEKLQATIAAEAKSFDEAKRIDGILKRLQYYIELGARLHHQIDKIIQSMFMSREFKRQYGQDSNVNLRHVKGLGSQWACCVW